MSPVLPKYSNSLPHQWEQFNFFFEQCIFKEYRGLGFGLFVCLTVETVHVWRTGLREDISLQQLQFQHQQINSLQQISTGVELKSGSNQQPLSIRNSSKKKKTFKHSWSLLVVGIGFRYLIPWGESPSPAFACLGCGTKKPQGVDGCKETMASDTCWEK